MSLEEAVVSCNTSEPCKFPSFGSCQNRFPWTRKGAEFAPHPVVGLVFQVGHLEKFPPALGFEGMDPFLGVSKHGPYFMAIQDGGDKRLV